MVKQQIAGKMSKAKTREKIFIFITLLYPLAQFSVFYIAVNFNSVLLAFQRYNRDMTISYVGLSNFKQALESIKSSGGLLGISIRNSLLIFTSTLVIGFPLNMLFSYYVYKKKFAATLMRFILFLPAIISGMVIALVFLKFTEQALPSIFKARGITIPILLQDKKTALWTIIAFMLWTGFSSSLILYPNAMNSIPIEIIEGAQIDGVTPLQELWYIVIRLIYPTITTFMVTGVASILAIQGPLFVFYEYQAPAEVYTTGYFLFRTVMKSDSAQAYPFAAATGLIFTAISVPLTLTVKHIMEKYGPVSEY